jgi:hypothetical protein
MCWVIFRGLFLLLLVLGLGGGGGGCMTSKSGHKLVWRTLSKGLTSGLAEHRRQVIRDELEYLKVWAEHAATVNRVALPPAVDFSREMVVVVAMGERPTGGYVTEVVDVELRGRTLRVLVGEREPRPGTMQIQARTQPFAFVALPAMTAHVQFRTVEETHPFGVPRSSRPGSEVREEAPPASDPGVSRSRAPVNPVESPRGATR